MTPQPTTDPTSVTQGGGVTQDLAGPAGDRSSRPPSTLVDVLRHHRLALIAGVVAGLLVGLLLSFLQPVSYTSESRVFFSSQNAFDPLGTNPFASDPSRYLEQQAALLTSEPVLDEAVEADETIGDVAEVQRSLTVTASREADIVTVRSVADDEDRAVARVVAVVSAYRNYQRASVADKAEALSEISNASETRQIAQRAALYGDGVDLVEPPSTDQASPLVRNLIAGGLAGLLIALALSVLRRRRSSPAPARPSRGRRRQPRNQHTGDDGWDWELDRRT